MINKKKNLGRTMIETLAVLSIIGMLSATAASIVADAMETYKINALNNQVFNVYQRTVASFKVDGSYANLGATSTEGNKEALRRELVPASMKPKTTEAITANRIIHAFRGAFEIFASGTSNQNFTMRLKGIEDAGCMGLLTALPPEIFITARVGEFAVGSLDVSDIHTACTNATAENSNIEIDFKTDYFFSK